MSTRTGEPEYRLSDVKIETAGRVEPNLLPMRDDLRDLALRVLQLLNAGSGTTDAIRDILLHIKDFSRFDAVGVRIRAGSDFPYYKTSGFPARFREAESDDLEKTLLIRLCADQELSAKTFFVMIRLVETTGDIADHLENSADMMRIMIAR